MAKEIKILHLSDLHLGKRLNDYSLIEDQEYILKSILKTVDDEKIDTVIISGDIYDRSIPSEEAIRLYDFFIDKLVKKRNLSTFVISGNHDSSERLSVHNNILWNLGLYISGTYKGNCEAVELEDVYGKIYFHMLPFVKPIMVKSAFSEEKIESYTDAVKCAISHMNVDFNQRNILLSHQFVTGAQHCDSEDKTIGGLDNVDDSVFDGFDYVALGHLHIPQKIRDNIVYCGSPLKYSFSEMKEAKHLTIIDIKEKGNMEVKEIPLKPLHDLSEIKGSYNELTDEKYSSKTNKEDYLRVVLTDENDIPNAMGNLSKIYPYIMELRYDNTRTRLEQQDLSTLDVENKTTLELFGELYTKQNGMDMSNEQSDYMASLIQKVEEDSQ